MTASEIIELLSQKHLDDVFIPECKNGETRGSNYCRMDAWVMKKSWAHPLVMGYEIKVSRGDFLQDNKWTKYLGLCNEFYFVCPWGLIDKSELPEEAGLIYVNQKATGSTTKKKAPNRTVKIPESIFRYILMSRIKIIKEKNEISKKDFWKSWLSEKDNNKKFSRLISNGIKNIVLEKCQALIKEISEVKEENQQLQNVKKRMQELGVDINKKYFAWDATRKLEEHRKIIPNYLVNYARRLKTDIDNFIDAAQNREKELETRALKQETHHEHAQG